MYSNRGYVAMLEAFHGDRDSNGAERAADLDPDVDINTDKNTATGHSIIQPTAKNSGPSAPRCSTEEVQVRGAVGPVTMTGRGDGDGDGNGNGIRRRIVTMSSRAQDTQNPNIVTQTSEIVRGGSVSGSDVGITPTKTGGVPLEQPEGWIAGDAGEGHITPCWEGYQLILHLHSWGNKNGDGGRGRGVGDASQ